MSVILAAEPLAQVSGHAADKRLRALRLGAAAPAIDGRLDDAAWDEAEWASDFLQAEPDRGTPPTERTEIAMAYDDAALYVAARLHARDPAAIAAGMTRRDDPGNADRFVVFLDTYHDRRTAYAFGVTAAGVRLDWYHPEDDRDRRDFTWNAVWEARTAVGPRGWTAEMRIPFSQLRFSGAEDQTWGVNLQRHTPGRNEEDGWIVVARDERGWSSRFGELDGIRRIGAGRRLEVRPYVAGDATLTSGGLLEEGDPFRDGRDVAVRTGVDAKLGLGPNLTLEATLNPDFGQVEADPAQVNLSAFESVFDERRPFFTEGRQLLEGNGPRYFYSRRIGAPPHGHADGDFTLVPQTTTILGAGKLTGRLPSGLSVGALAAMTGEERASTFDVEDEQFDEIRVEPRTFYGVARVEREGSDGSTWGATLTGTRRGLAEGEREPGGSLTRTPLAHLLSRQALSGGVDWDQRLRGGEYALTGHLGASAISGTQAALATIQRNSGHYFQRPDAGHVVLDSTRTSLNGWAAELRGEKRSGQWRGDLRAEFQSPGFEINDLGQMFASDVIIGSGFVERRETEPGQWFRRWDAGVWSWNRWNFGGTRTASNAGGWVNATWNNFWTGFADLFIGLPSLDDRLTRGGPLMARPRLWRAGAGVGSSETAATRWTARARTGRDALGGWLAEAETSLRLRPNDRLELAIEPRYERRRDARQFLDSRSGGPAETFGSRYLFGRIDRSELALPARVNLALSPDLSLDAYVEPFAASGRYADIGQLAASRTSDLLVYGTGGTTVERSGNGDYDFSVDGEVVTIENPDFDLLSFRSNAVLRWEWQPGSTLFLVWQQNRSAADESGSPVGPGELWESLGVEGSNLLALKMTYWLPL